MLSHSPSIVTDGLVLCLDAANPRSYSGSGTSWLDLSGQGNNGILTNGPTFSSANGGSIVFDGTNDYALFANPVILTSAMSVSLWYKADTIGLNKGLIYTNGSTEEGLRFNTGIQYYSSGVNVVRINTAPVGRWTYIVFTRLSNGVATAYLDGDISASGSGTGFTAYGLALDYNISSGRHFDGQISNVLMYNRALTADEVRRNYLATKSRFGL